ncbi:phage major tail tube protein [Paenibacillus sp. FJAT-26967]|uniref:phage major tail tube protein n=1 Tax=Paenibacillus sp. FJAT-26967 TaxID=1729690 RepID=UPI000838611C|nr:phage major tail tube protein [Paenibacillus sp. FJAT-26967]
MSKKIRDKIVGYTVYRNGSQYLGVATVELPSLEYMSETIKGAGIAGEVESPTIGQFGSMTCSLTWSTMDPAALELLAPEAHALDFRASQQSYNTATGVYATEGAKITVRAIPKTAELGSLEVGAPMDGSTEFEVVYMKISVGEKVMLELDKFNYIFIVNGVDRLKQVREQLGL